jgi:hypothetical protein
VVPNASKYLQEPSSKKKNYSYTQQLRGNARKQYQLKHAATRSRLL